MTENTRPQDAQTEREATRRRIGVIIRDTLNSRLPLDSTGHIRHCGFDLDDACVCSRLALYVTDAVVNAITPRDEAAVKAEALEEGFADGSRQDAEGEDGPKFTNPYRAAALTEEADRV